MTVELHQPDDIQDDVIDAEIVEPGTVDRLKDAYAVQRVRVAARLRRWYAAEDLTEEKIYAKAVERLRLKKQGKDDKLTDDVARIRTQLGQAKARARAHEAVGGESMSHTYEIERLNGQLAAAEARVEIRAGDGRKSTATDVPVPTAKDLSHERWIRKAKRAGATAAAGFGWLQLLAADFLIGLGVSAIAVPVAWWYLAREDDDLDDQQQGQEQRQADADVDGSRVSFVKERRAIPEAAPADEGGQAAEVFDVPTIPDFEAPPPPALSGEVLTTALRNIGLVRPSDTVKVLVAPPFGSDGTATIVADLPPYVTVAAVKKKQEDLAAALGRDVSMIDIDKAGAAGRMSLWLADSEPFEPPRPSPLLKTTGSLDSWRDGVPVAWAKRGNAVRLPVTNANFLIAGMTRSGKGVGAANLAAGGALDPWVNLRIVAGKNNGEWDPYAKSGVAATYFKPSPQRLLALLRALLADKDRREADLGKLGKSKLVPDAVPRLGGRELLVIDELATYTRPGKPLRDEILEALIELSAVAAGAGILLVLITQYPEADVIPSGLAMNCGARWAMRVDNGQQSNAILGGGQASNGRDASKFDPPIPGLGWLVNPFAGVTDLARSFDLDEDERGEVSQLLTRAAELRREAGRLTGQWADPIETQLVRETGLSSAAGGPGHDGHPGRALANLSPEQKAAYEAVASALDVMERFGRDAQLEEMATEIGDGMTAETLGQLLRTVGAGPTVKVTIDGRRVQGYRRDTLRDLLDDPGST